MTYDPGQGLTTITEVDQLILHGTTLHPDLRRSVTDIRFSMRHDAVSEITITLDDTGFRFLADKFFRINDYVGYRGRHFYVAAIETGGHKAGFRGEKVTIYCHPRFIQKLKALTGPFTMSNASASEFVAHEAAAVGMKSLCQPCAKRSQVARDQPQEGYDPKYDEQPSSWTTFRKLAGEEGFVTFEAVGVIFFGKPTWIITQTTSFTVSYNKHNVETDAIAVPVCKISANEIASPTSISAQVVNTRGHLAVPGKKLILSGVPYFDGGYLLTGVDYSLVRYDSCTITAETPQDPQKPDPVVPPGGPGGPGGPVAPGWQLEGTKPWVHDTGVSIGTQWKIATIYGLASRPNNPASDHPKGLALDFMCDWFQGEGIANQLTAQWQGGFSWHSRVNYVIWYREINSLDGNGWRDYTGDNDHTDHVHVSFHATYPYTGDRYADGSSPDNAQMMITEQQVVQRGSSRQFMTLASAGLDDQQRYTAHKIDSEQDDLAWNEAQMIERCLAQMGISVPRTPDMLMQWITDQGGKIPVAQAFATRGALLGYPGHVAISRGDGSTIEVAGSRVGIVAVSPEGRFTWAGKLTELVY